MRSLTRPLPRANATLDRRAAGDPAQALHGEGREEPLQMIRGQAQTQAALRELVQARQGITQFALAVGQRDQATPPHTALVEASAAAAASLRPQAEHLRSATSVFRLDGENHFSHSPS